MAAGFQVFGPTGDVRLDSSSRLFQYLGHFDVTRGDQSGTITDSRLSQGTVQIIPVPRSNTAMYYVPTISVSGNTLTYTGSFTQAGSQAPQIALRIIYGIY